MTEASTGLIGSGFLTNFRQLDIVPNQLTLFILKHYYFLNIIISISFFGCNSNIPEGTEAISKISPEYYSTWQHYLGDPGRSHFSVLNEINETNVSKLKKAWAYESGGLVEGSITQIQTNPLIVGDKLFGVNAEVSLFALDAATGEQLWEFKPVADGSGLGLKRGLNFWPSDGVDQDRLLFAAGFRLYALDPDTGTLIESFGEGGRVDLRKGLGRDHEKLSVMANTPGAVFEDMLILGTRVNESPGAAPGHVRAYDVLTGEIKWIFYTIPQPGDFGYETWSPESYLTVGGANSWSGITLDEERGIVFIPTGSAAFDFYGGDRKGENLFANTLLALDANTGERIWHFQMVHHDIWDRDLPAPPNLLEVERNGKKIPTVAQVTKSGHIYVFNRETGEPLFPIEEKVYPASKLVGEEVYRTQPLPLWPKPFSRQILTEDDLYAPDRPAFVDDFVDKEQNINPPTVREKFRQVTSNGQFIPADTKGVIVYPGFDGGAEWGGAALDPRNGVMYVNSNEMAWILRMRKIGGENDEELSAGATLTQIHCARCHGGQLQGLGDVPDIRDVKPRLTGDSIRSNIRNGRGAMTPFPNLTDEEVNSIVDFLLGQEEVDHRAEVTYDAPYSVAGFGRFKDDRGFPVVKPPWGLLNAVDLNSGEYLWQVPLGNEEALDDPDYPVTGTENYGGPVITAGGVLFIAATRDEKFRAFSMKTGEQLWETDLPAGGYATPATYKIGGKQFVVIACGGGKMRTKSGDSYIAFSLP